MDEHVDECRLCGVLKGNCSCFPVWVDNTFEILLSFPIQQPEVTHFHGMGALTFDSAIDNANGSSVVNVY
jgi:hypothetical protein